MAPHSWSTALPPASITWSALELGRDAATYRAGIEFADAHPEFLEVVEPPTIV